MNIASTTSTVIRQFFGSEAAVVDGIEIFNDVIAPFPAFRDAFTKIVSGRAAFIIPQTCVVLGFEATLGRSPSAAELRHVSPFSILCLSLAIGDDLIDEQEEDFASRMQQGWAAMILNRYAYRDLYTCPMPNATRTALSEAMDRLIESVSNVAAAEINYAGHEFADQAYLDLARTKTSCYTRHALQLGCSLAGGAPVTNESLSRIGDHLGASLQLLDDALDAAKDSTGDHAATLASVLAQRGQSLKTVFELAGHEIRSAIDIAASLPFPEKLSGTLQRAGGFLRFLQ